MSLKPVARFSCLIALLATLLPCAASAGDDGFVLFLDEYLYGDFYVAELGDIDVNDSHFIRPRRLRLPSPFGRDYEIGNADVAVDGRSIVFAARHVVEALRKAG